MILLEDENKHKEAIFKNELFLCQKDLILSHFLQWRARASKELSKGKWTILT